MPISKEKLEHISEQYPDEYVDKTLNGGLLTLSNYMSGPRATMHITHQVQRLMLTEPEIPGMYTGYEKGFGNFSDGFKIAESDYHIVGIVHRHSGFPSMKFMMIIQDLITGTYDVVEICHYEKLSESHGYMKPPSAMLDKIVGGTIRRGEYFYKPSSLDEYNNYRYGINAKVAYSSILETTEDAICVRKGFADKVRFHTIDDVDITINTNELMLNLYGDENIYKFMPAIGEEVPETGIICRKRRVELAKASSSITNLSLATPQNNDISYKSAGKVVDINIFVNNRMELEVDKNREQLLVIYEDQLRYNKELVKVMEPIMKNKRSNTTTHFKHVFNDAKNYVNNSNTTSKTEYKYCNNSGQFEFAYLNIKIAKLNKLGLGYKLVNRFAAKGVISAIIDDEYMPRDVDGNVADIILSPPGVIGRANSGQLYEHEINFCAAKIHKYMKEEMTDRDERFALYIKFMSMVNVEEAEFILEKWKKMNDFHKTEFINSIVNGERIYIRQAPFHGNLNLDELEMIYDEFNIHPSFIRTRIEFEDVLDKENRYMSQQNYELRKKMYENYLMDDEKINKSAIGISNIMQHYANPNKTSKNVLEINGEKYYKSDIVYGIGDLYRYNQRKPTLIESILNGIKLLQDIKKDMKREEFLSDKVYLSINERGNLVRDIRSEERVIIAEEYIMVLKQTSVAGFSARSIGEVSQSGIPVKGRNTNEKSISNSPTKFGEMEVANALRRLKPEIVHRFMAERATNLKFRKEISKMLLLDDPLELHDVDVKDEDIINDIPARILAEYIRALGGKFIESGEIDNINNFIDNLPMDDLDKYFRDKAS